MDKKALLKRRKIETLSVKERQHLWAHIVCFIVSLHLNKT